MWPWQPSNDCVEPSTYKELFRLKGARAAKESARRHRSDTLRNPNASAFALSFQIPVALQGDVECYAVLLKKTTALMKTGQRSVAPKSWLHRT